ncbi:MAG: hypothetical protein GXP16_00475 [Gammaproteobacteria bacterium]|nr:hypothetical protein [Gammaproteobacteria bacterium]
MLQKLRDQTQGIGFRILVGAIILVLVLFGFGASNIFLGADPEIASVGDFEITQSVLGVETERERRRVLAQMGEDFDPSNIDKLQLQQYALQQLINRHVLYQTADDLGVGVPPDTVNKTLLESEVYKVDGQFNEAVYRQQLQLLGFTPVDFVVEFTHALSSEQLRGGIIDTSFMPDWELKEIVRVLNQKRDLAYLPLSIETFSNRVTVTDEEIELRYHEDQTQYMTELALDVQYLSMQVQDLANDSGIEVTEDDISSLYEEERNAALRDEQRDSSHILIQINDDRTEDQALQLITEVSTRINAGEAFADLAEELSEDPGSAAQAGSLGAVGKGIFDPAFENALWALAEEGAISAPVLTAFGYHLIRLDGIIQPRYPELAEQRDELELRVRRDKAAELFTDRALALERSVYEERFSLDSTAESLGLQAISVNGVSRSSPGEDANLNQAMVLNALFSEDVLAGNNSEVLASGDEQVLVVRVNKQYAPEVIPFEQVSQQIRETITSEKALAEIEIAKQTGFDQLSAGESVADIASSYDSEWKRFTLASRSPRSAAEASIPAQVLTSAFELPRPTPGSKSVGIVTLPQGAALVTVTRVVQGDISTTTAAELAEIRRATANRASRLDFQSLYQSAEDRVGVSKPTLAPPISG